MMNHPNVGPIGTALSSSHPLNMVVDVAGGQSILSTSESRVLSWVESYLAQAWNTWRTGAGPDGRLPHVRATLDAGLYAELAETARRHGSETSSFLRVPATVTAQGSTRVVFCPGQRAVYLRDGRNFAAVSDSFDGLRLASLRTLRDVVTAALEGAGWVQFHAACAERDGRLVLILGSKGAGKSTSVLTLATRKGWRVLANDRVMIRSDRTGVRAVPWPSPVNVGLGLLSALSWFDVVHRAYNGSQPFAPNQPARVTEALRLGLPGPLHAATGEELKCELMPYHLHDWFSVQGALDGTIDLLLFPRVDRTAGDPEVVDDPAAVAGRNDLMPPPGKPNQFPDFLALRAGRSEPSRWRRIDDTLAHLRRIPRLSVRLGTDVGRNAEFLDDVISGALRHRLTVNPE